jgi:hypothetical protein
VEKIAEKETEMQFVSQLIIEKQDRVLSFSRDDKFLQIKKLTAVCRNRGPVLWRYNHNRVEDHFTSSIFLVAEKWFVCSE